MKYYLKRLSLSAKAIPNDGGLIKKSNEMIKHIRLYEKFLEIKEVIDGYRIAYDNMIKNCITN